MGTTILEKNIIKRENIRSQKEAFRIKKISLRKVIFIGLKNL